MAEGDTAEIRNPSKDVIGMARKTNKLNEFISYVSKEIVCATVDVSTNIVGLKTTEKWHRALRHVNYKDLRVLCSK